MTSERPSINYNAFCLQAGQITGDKFADGSDLRRQFLIVGRQRNLNALCYFPTFDLRHAKQICAQSPANRRK